MEVMLDTNAYNDWVRKGLWKNAISSADRVWIPTVVIGELYRGFISGNRFSVNEALLREVLDQPVVAVVDINIESARIYGELLHFLCKVGKMIPTNDIWIAAASIERGASLLTSDKHFERLPQVRLARREF
jgi:tRNA(fMet)-specific endonuclease VapC